MVPTYTASTISISSLCHGRGNDDRDRSPKRSFPGVLEGDFKNAQRHQPKITIMENDRDPLLPTTASPAKIYGANDDVEDPKRPRPASLHGTSPFLPKNESILSNKSQSSAKAAHVQKREKSGSTQRFLYFIIYALVNVIISAPGLYGYAAVIFNNPIFGDHMNALSKLVLFSSLVHQLGFLLFSSLDFAIGTVQDAGLIFLSAMANKIANRMQDDGESEHAIVSTTLVLLSLGTASLGVVLIVIGKFGLANAVSYLPMSVVGGYLAFIGYFCCQAGVALCISRPLMTLMDWKYVVTVPENLLLAAPGLLAGMLLTLVSRGVKNEGALPLAMIIIPALFYIVIAITGVGLDGAREGGWVGPVAPSVPVTDLFQLVDFSLVRWDLIARIWTTWVGMVFVVSFASCLDVAAISMDMGEALDTNKELATVGICNCKSLSISM